MIEEVRRREFIKSAFLGANGLILSGQKLDFLTRGQFSKQVANAYNPVAGLIYENDFSANLDGVVSHAALNLRVEGGQMKFSTTNAGRGVYVGPAYPEGGKQYKLVIKLNNTGIGGVKVYRSRVDANTYIQTITTTNEVSIDFASAGTEVDNRLYLATGGPEYDIALDYVKIYEVDSVQAEGDLWIGTYQQTVNNRLYTWIPSRDATIMPQPNGSVVLRAPVTKRSFEGGNNCERFVFDENYRRLGSGFLNDLAGFGVHLPDGHYHFLIHYFSAPSYDVVDSDTWRLAGNPSTYRYYSAQPEAVSFSIETLGANKAHNRVSVPVAQERVSWVISNQFLPENLEMPAGKDFGITKLHWDVVANDKYANLNEVLKKVSQIQVAGRVELDSISPDRLWDCIMGTGQTPHQIAYDKRLTPRHTILGQMKEQGLSNWELEEAFRLIYRRLQNEHGITNPNQARVFEDYFASVDGYGNGAMFINDTTDYELKKRQLSSKEEAKKLYSLHFGSSDYPLSEYFKQNAYAYRNRSASGYLDSYHRNPNGIMLYKHIFEYEKCYIAANDRNVVCMSWSQSEGVNSQTTRAGVRYRLKLTKGDLLRNQPVGLPYELLMNQCFFSLLLGNTFVLWNDSINLVKNINNWDPASIDGYVEYHANGDTHPTSWNIDNSSHPKPVQSPIVVNGRGTQFPSAPQIGEQGAWVGAYLYSQISKASDRVSRSIRYASFSYRVNDGGNQSGYRNGNDPMNGSLGNAELSRPGYANEGQHNIVDQWQFQKPIVVLTQGDNGFAVVVKNVFCEPTDRVVYSVQVNGSNKEITHVGRSLGVYLFS
jgi:hypothetical protein